MKLILPPIPVLLVWLEVNITGQTILPEIFTCIAVGSYAIWRILWRLKFVTLKHGMERGFM